MIARRALVTGGGGFLGRAIVERLLAEGVEVRSFSRGSYPELEALGARCHRGDLCDGEALRRAAEGCDLVFHVAARPGVWGPHESYHRPNVVGTETVLATCRALSIGRLVYTSSPSVVFDGASCEGADESLPYPERYETSYPATKAEAERAVLAANGPALATVSLRPHLIWGPRDPNLIPRIVRRARTGRLRRVGDGRNRVDTVYVDNAADAHLAAARVLAPDAPCAGRAYFVANDEPVELWPFIDRILACAGLPPVRRSISAANAWRVGWLLEKVWSLFGLAGEPPMTRFVAHELSTSHWFDLGAARRDLGWAPRVSVDEGLRRLEAWLRENPIP